MPAGSRPLRVRVWPGLSERAALLGPGLPWPAPPAPGPDLEVPDPERLDPERLDLEALAELAEAAELRGRGGAGFPFAVKLRAVAEQAGRTGLAPVVVLNGEEGEPASAKDRVLMTLNPGLALEGLRLVAAALGAETSYAYVSDPAARERIAAAGAVWPGPGALRVVAAPSGYVSGEETAVVRWLDGGPAKPTHKPPRPYESGVAGRPTLVGNVETFAQLARLVRRRTEGDGLTVLLTVGTDRGEHVVVEVPDDRTLGDVLAWLRVDADEVLLGGFFGRFVSTGTRGRPLRELASRAHPDVLGCGIVLALHDTCPVSAVAQVLRYLDRENAEQCGPCFKGIPAMAGVADALAAGTAGAEDVQRLAGWGTSLRGRGDCGTLDAACGVVTSLLEQRADVVARHLEAPCGWCADHPERPEATAFAVPWPAEIKEER
nr:NADH-ubiquinone oxidoreductase-F iron-sulfur binding region domain-containing protein [Nocardioides soli]